MSNKIEQIKHYKIVDKLGSGGMGVVFRAFDTVLEREVAIKVMHRSLTEDKQNAQRLIREAKAAAKLVHPNVVTIYEVGEDDHGKYIVMEYVKGAPLSDVLAKKGIFKPQRSVNLIIQVLKALNTAHKLGILHRDIKSENILITNDDIAKVLDYGIAQITAKSRITSSGQVLGTIEYMAPEQMLGEDIDQRCDIYATGVVFYQMLTNVLPFSGETAVEVLFKKLNEEPPPPSYYNNKIDKNLDDAVLKMIHHNKSDRWENAEDLIPYLETISDAKTISLSKTWMAEADFDLEEDEGEEEKKDESVNLRSVFVGREDEFKKLVNIFNRIKGGVGQTVLISGEAGVGKSRLANQFCYFVDHQDVWVLYGNCLYQEGMDAYMPYIDALRNFFSKDNPKLDENERIDLKNIIREEVPVLSQFTERFTTTIFSELSNKKDVLPENKTNLNEGISVLLSLMAKNKPVVLIIDDLQWADGASLKLFHYLARQIVKMPVMLLGIHRTDKYDLQDDGKPKAIVDMIKRMRNEDVCHEINLDRLNREKCDLLIDKSLVNTAFSEDFYGGVFQGTKGNPFFVIETLKLLSEKKYIYPVDHLWLDKKIDFKIEVPSRVEDIFIRRLSTLSEDDREMLQVASVIGYKFDPSTLANLLEIPKIDMLKRLHKIERDLQIITSSKKDYQFEHPMLGDLLYNEIPPALCQEYHLMIANELEKIHRGDFGALVGEAAQHFRRGGDHKKAIPLLYQAGKRAFNISAYKEACMFFEDLIESIKEIGSTIKEEVPEKDFYFNVSICYEEVGNWEQGLKMNEKLTEICAKIEDYDCQVSAKIRIGRIYDKMGDWSASLEAYTKCLELAEKYEIKNVFSRVYNKIGVFYFHKGDFDNALKYFQKTLHSVDSDFGEFDKAHAHTNIGIIANIIRGKHSIALENFKKAIKIYEVKNSTQDLARVHHNIGMFHSNHGEWLESIKAYEKCLKLADEVESRHLIALTYLNMGKAYARQKALKKAKSLTEKALKIFKRMSDLISIAEAYQVFGLIYGAEENFAKAQDYLKQAINIFSSKNYREGQAESRKTLANLYKEYGYWDEAKEYYFQALDDFRELNMESEAKEISKALRSIEMVDEDRHTARVSK